MNQNFNSVTVNGVTYYANKPQEPNGDIKIVILQLGWIMIGRLERKGSECKLHNASVIRNWGTVGEIAIGGPTSSTKLDKCGGIVEFNYLNVVCVISCDEEKWKNVL